jgi:hypothetical protein
MRGILLVRIAAVAAALAGASFMSLPSLSGVSLFGPDSPMSVNRSLKGDRLPVVARHALPADLGSHLGSPLGSPQPLHAQTHDKPPVGCEGVFSPVASPLLANVFKRCLV